MTATSRLRSWATADRLVAGAAPRPATAPPEPAIRPPLRVVEADELSPRARRRRTRWVAAATAVLLCAGLFGVVAFHVVLTQGQFRLDRLDSQVTQQQAEYDRLRLQVATLESPGRIVAVAQERLGMVPPPSVRYLSPANGVPPAGGTKAPTTTATTVAHPASTTVAGATATTAKPSTSLPAGHPTTTPTTTAAKSTPTTTTAPARSGPASSPSTTVAAHR